MTVTAAMLSEYSVRIDALHKELSAEFDTKLAEFDDLARFGFASIERFLPNIQIWTPQDEDNVHAPADADFDADDTHADYFGDAKEFDPRKYFDKNDKKRRTFFQNLDSSGLHIILWPNHHLDEKTFARWLKKYESRCKICGCACELDHKTTHAFLAERDAERKRHLRDAFLSRMTEADRIRFVRNELLRKLLLDYIRSMDLGQEAIKREIGFPKFEFRPELSDRRRERKLKEIAVRLQASCDCLNFGSDIRDGAMEITVRNAGAHVRSSILVASALHALVERDGNYVIPRKLSERIRTASGVRTRRAFVKTYTALLYSERLLLAHSAEILAEEAEEKRLEAWLYPRALRQLRA